MVVAAHAVLVQVLVHVHDEVVVLLGERVELLAVLTLFDPQRQETLETLPTSQQQQWGHPESKPADKGKPL